MIFPKTERQLDPGERGARQDMGAFGLPGQRPTNLLRPQAVYRGLRRFSIDASQDPEHSHDVATQMKELPKDSA